MPHDGIGDHVHELTHDQRGKLVEYIWKVENVELTTVGIDIGSSTSHLMFSRVRLQRRTQALSSEFVVTERRMLHQSPIVFTPFRADGLIDVEVLRTFIADAYRDAGLAAGDVDTGAVILTGEAIKRENARAIADLFAAESGKFVCASAGHHLECALAAQGSGAAMMSREMKRTLLNVDIGGGTTKLALVRGGEVVATAAIAVGARVDRNVMEMAADVVDAVRGRWNAAAMLTEALPAAPAPEAIVFSGGVSEFIYGTESRDFGDQAQALAACIVAKLQSGAIALPLLPARERIRATVIGASQFTVQVSGKTIFIPDESILPLRNLPVVTDLAHPSAPLDEPLAIAIRWKGDPEYSALRAMAEGLEFHLGPRMFVSGASQPRDPRPVILITDADIARTLGHILVDELHFPRPLVCIDGIRLRAYDFIDVGEVVRPADVVPVVIKSLLFPASKRKPT
jgi:ethanolamine utilization protein EutA